MSDHSAPTPESGPQDPPHQAYGQPGPYGQQAPYGQQPPYGQQANFGEKANYGQPHPGPYSGPRAPGQPEPPLTQDGDRLVATFEHLLNIAAPAVGPLVLWLITRRRGPLADSEGREALNFGITVAIVSLGIAVLSVLSLLGGPLALLMPLLLPLLWVAVVVFAILGAMQANQGRPYRYPVVIRLVT